MTPETYYAEKRNALPYAKERSHPRMSIDNLDLTKIKTIHIVGICGTAMASLAQLLVEKGYTVTGSDQACYPPMSDVLKSLNIDVLPFDIKNLEHKDMIIIGNVCGPMNIEATHCRDNNLPYFSVGEAVSFLCIEDRKSIVVAGTHGKTTTTSIAISAYTQTGSNPSYLVGGVLQETQTSAHYDARSELFIIEGDEYDTSYFDKGPKFLHYKPYVSIITSIELDHVDIYKDIEDYRQAFRFLIEATDPKGLVISCIDDKEVKNLITQVKTHNIPQTIITYGKDVDADFCLVNIETHTEGQRVTVKDSQTGLVDIFDISLFGEYNALNATAVYVSATFLHVDIEKIKESFKNFQGAKRRQEIVAVKNGVTIIDDFAHHPTAVFKTLKGIKERFPNSRIVAIFEPRSTSSRTKTFEEEYGNAFQYADRVCISVPPMKKDYNPDDFMDVRKVAEAIEHHGISCMTFSGADEIIEQLKTEIRPNDVLVVMSNGDFDGIHGKLAQVL